MKAIRMTAMMVALLMWTNAYADITDVTTDGELEVVTQTQGVDRHQIQTNVVDVTSFDHSLMTNSAFGGSTVTASAEQNTMLSVAGNTLSLISIANTDISATLSGDPTNDFFTGGTGLAVFSIDFTVSEQSTITVGGQVSVTTPGDFGSTDSQVCFDMPTNVCFEAEDDAGDPRQVTISGSGVLEPGTYSIFMFLLSTLSETQTNSQGHWDVTVNVAPGGPPPPPPSNNVDLVALEVVQTIQDWNNSVPLIAGKRTFVRAHLESPNFVVFEGKLRGFRDGMELPGSPLTTVNAAGSVITQPFPSEVRNNLADSLNFRLPDSWLDGTVQLTLEGDDLTCHEPAEAGGTAGDCQVQVTFTNAPPPLQVHFLRLRWRDHSGTLFDPTNADINELINRLVAVYPIRDLDVTAPGFVNLPERVATNVNKVVDRLALLRTLDGCALGCERLYYGVLRGPDRGGVALPKNKAACGTMVDGFDGSRNTHAHEIGHLLGREHAVSEPLFGLGPCLFEPGFSGVHGACDECVPTNGNPVIVDFPFFSDLTGFGDLSPTLGPMDLGINKLIFGLDTFATRVADPNEHFELMSYCNADFDWISTFTYEGIRTAIDNKFPAAFAARSVAAAPIQDFLLVRGTVNIVDDTTVFSDFQLLSTDTPPPSPSPGDYTLQMLDTNGHVITEVSFQPVTAEPGTIATASPLGTFLITVPSDPAIRQAVVLHNGNPLATRTASTNTPTIQVLFPNGGETVLDNPVILAWDADDVDSDLLTYVVQYSANGGITFETLAVDWPDKTFSIAPEFLKGGSNALLRVTASDGFNTATDVSDATFTIPNNAPQVFILTPTENQLFSGVQQIFLEAFALDREDGVLPGDDLLWTSNLDGALGTGKVINFQADQLSAGTHLITVAATDSGSLTSTATVHIVVAQQVPTALADLFVTKTLEPDPAFIGQTLTYTVTVENQGPNTADSVTLSDALPPSVTFVSATPSQGNCTVSGTNVTCNLGSLPSGNSATAIIVVRSSVAAILTNSASAVSSVTDPVPANNTATAIVSATVPHDLAVLSIKAPKKITLSETKPSQTKAVKIQIQNLGSHSETITNETMLTDLVLLTIESLGDCPVPAAQLVPPKKGFPVILAPKKKLTVAYNVTFDCANDPLATTKDAGHSDVQYAVSVNHAALDGLADTEPENNNCPRGPNGNDKGCGGKDPATKQLGADVLTDVVVK